MKSLNNRVSNLEQRHGSKSRPPAHVVIKNKDESVSVQLPDDGGTKEFSSEAKANQFLNEQELKEANRLNVLIVNSQGKKPHVS